MDLFIEKELLKFKTHIIDYAALKSILVNAGYKSINDKIENLKQKGIIKSLKKGLYVHISQVNKNIISKEIISNNLLNAPSYISLDYALYYYGLIPESVHIITAVTTNRSKKYKNDFGVFWYKQIKPSLFATGLKTEKTQSGNFLIASKEKAICDKIYFTRNVELTSKKNMYDFLENDLRIDIDEFKNSDIGIISEYSEKSKSKKINLFLKLIKEL